MTITALTTDRVGSTTTVTATSDLVGDVYFHWYIDGQYVGASVSNTRSFSVAAGEQLRVDVLDTADPDFDAVAGAPAGWPARRTITWLKSIDSSVRQYRVEQQQDGGDWEQIALVNAAATPKWEYEVLTPRLVDLSEYAWRIIPLDAAGNEGDALELGPETVVRAPDAPQFGITYDPAGRTVEFAAA